MIELTLDQALKKGIEAHKAGQFTEADRYYTAILKAQPKHPDANHNMGILAVGIGKVQESLPFLKTALEANPNITHFWLSYIKALIKLNRVAEAKALFNQAKSNDVKGDGFDQIEKRLIALEKKLEVNVNSRKLQDPTQDQLQSLINLYTQGLFHKALTQGSQLLKEFPNSINLYNIIGTTNKSLGKLEEAIEAYNKAILLKPDFAEAHYNIGNTLKKQGKLEEATEAFRKALDIKPDYAEVYINMGNALQGQGKLDEAIKAYNKVISLKPNFAEAYNNMGSALKDQGKQEKAIEAYSKALSLKPDYANAHRNLSSIKQYNIEDEQFLQVKEQYRIGELSEDVRCNLSFALAKMYEDIGDLNQAFNHLYKGNALRKKLLNYSIKTDKSLFNSLKKTQPNLLKSSLEIKKGSSGLSPVFIVGMPRSGTTLVEQIISSHSEVTGAGELNYVAQYGGKLAINSTPATTVAVSDFRKKYLLKLSKVSNGERVVTDKMPQNFRFIPLICAAFPEAKIVHVQRNATATCWSNYKKYFVSKNIGYCYDLKDVVTYYFLYRDLMQLWQSHYYNRIYHLNYEDLTTDQENQTRKLIKYLELNWEEACLSPEKNKRSVRTASKQQVRKKVYKGSSNAWHKYEPYLNGVFGSLKS